MTEQEYIAAETNCETGETTYRPMTDEEIADIKAMAQEQEARNAALETELAAKAEAKASALAKLTALGLSEEEAKAIAG
jgi:hypothetical protein